MKDKPTHIDDIVLELNSLYVSNPKCYGTYIDIYNSYYKIAPKQI